MLRFPKLNNLRSKLNLEILKMYHRNSIFQLEKVSITRERGTSVTVLKTLVTGSFHDFFKSWTW